MQSSTTPAACNNSCVQLCTGHLKAWRCCFWWSYSNTIHQDHEILQRAPPCIEWSCLPAKPRPSPSSASPKAHSSMGVGAEGAKGQTSGRTIAWPSILILATLDLISSSLKDRCCHKCFLTPSQLCYTCSRGAWCFMKSFATATPKARG